MTERETARQLAEALELYLADTRPLDAATGTYEDAVERILDGEEVYVLGMETERVWR